MTLVLSLSLHPLERKFPLILFDGFLYEKFWSVSVTHHDDPGPGPRSPHSEVNTSSGQLRLPPPLQHSSGSVQAEDAAGRHAAPVYPATLGQVTWSWEQQHEETSSPLCHLVTHLWPPTHRWDTFSIWTGSFRPSYFATTGRTFCYLRSLTNEHHLLPGAVGLRCHDTEVVAGALVEREVVDDPVGESEVLSEPPVLLCRVAPNRPRLQRWDDRLGLYTEDQQRVC